MNRLDAEQFADLLRRHAASLVLYARQWCNAAEDVVQEAFLRLMRQAAPPDDPKAWLFHVVRNGAITASRANRRRKAREQTVAERNGAWFVSSPDDRLAAEEVAARLRELPLELRETIVARVWGGMSFAEIARLTETSISTAHRRYVEGLRTLRERLGASCPNNA